MLRFLLNFSREILELAIMFLVLRVKRETQHSR